MSAETAPHASGVMISYTAIWNALGSPPHHPDDQSEEDKAVEAILDLIAVRDFWRVRWERTFRSYLEIQGIPADEALVEVARVKALYTSGHP